MVHTINLAQGETETFPRHLKLEKSILPYKQFERISVFRINLTYYYKIVKLLVGGRGIVKSKILILLLHDCMSIGDIFTAL